MTVQTDLKKAVAAAQSALGSYQTFAESTQDQAAKLMYQELAVDMERHVDVLNARLKYLSNINPLNQQLT
jgi:bacterioferritin (cytochrome b1)